MYQPLPPPVGSGDLGIYLYQELQKIAAAVNKPSFDQYNQVTLYVAPTKPREGDTVKADGTKWNPGSGAGVYQYRSSAWVKVF